MHLDSEKESHLIIQIGKCIERLEAELGHSLVHSRKNFYTYLHETLWRLSTANVREVAGTTFLIELANHVMMTRLCRLRDGNFLIYLVFFLSVGYLAFLSFSIHDGIFYAGDQGIKALEVKQIAQGHGFKYLHLTQPAWVQSIWKAGFTPLRQPTFYNSPNGYLIVYPPAFQIISAWLYGIWGTAGLYIIPMTSTVILLLAFVWVLKRCGIKPMLIALAVFLLVFCSPLALYGVMFWEHLPAVLLLFAGLAFIASPPRKMGTAAVLGVVSGVAVFLRPEALMMDFLYALAVVILYFRDGKLPLQNRFFGDNRRLPFAFLATLAVLVLAFFIFNKIEYGFILGIHGRQVFTDKNPDTRMTWHHGFENLWQNNYISTSHFLLVLLLVPLIIRVIVRREKTDPRPALLTGIVIAFSLVTPWLLPNNGVVQWGARYFLAIIPITLVALFLAERQWNLLESNRLPLWLTGLIVAGILYCFYENTHSGGYKDVRWRYNQRLTKTYKLIDSQPGNVVILSHHWMINDFAWLFDKENFFAASNDDSLRRLLPLLKANGVHQYIFVFDPRVPTLPAMLKDSTTRHWWNDRAKNIWVKEEYAAKVYTIR